MSEVQAPPQVGDKAPAFKGQAVVGSKFHALSYADGVLKLDDKATKDKWLVLFFYPLNFTFVCPTEIIAFSDRIEEFKKIGCEVVGASIDSHFSHLAWKNLPRNQGGLGDIHYPLLADMKKEAATAYRVLLGGGVAARGLFIIDDKGVLQSYTVNNLAVGRSVDEVLRLVQGYQYTAKHGEACPAGWTPGADTMVPDPEGAKTYFAKVK